MAYNFPNSPSNGDTVTVNGITYTYNSTSGAWKTTATSGGGGGGGASVTVSETAPSSPSEGDLWFDPSVLKTFVYYNDGTTNQWVQSNPTGGGGASGGASVTVSETAPTSPSAGDLWWSSSEAVMYIYYTDTDSSQWVSTSTPGADGATGATGAAASVAYANLAAFPASPTEGDIAYAQDTNALYVYDGSEWDRISSGSDESPRVTTEPATSHSLSSSGATTTLTMVAEDPEGFDIEYGIKYNTSGGTRPSQLSADTTINQSTGVYTFTPSTSNSDAGTFNARLTASDGNRVTVRTIPFDLTFYPQLANVVGRYEFFNTSSYNTATSTTTLNDISGNSRNITITNPGSLSSDGFMTFNAGSTSMNFTGNQDSKSWAIIFRPPTGWTRSLFWGDGSATGNYYAAMHSSTADGTDYYGSGFVNTTWAGETRTDRVNSTSGVNRQTAHAALTLGQANSVTTTGLQFPSTYMYYAQHSGYIVTHEVYAIIFWDVVLTAAEVEAVHNYYRGLLGNANMAAW